MNPKKSGKLLTILMLALLAYGCGSSMSLVVSDSISLELPTFLATDNSQISIIGNPDFEPVYLRQRVITNVTNNTTPPTNISRNSSINNEN